jgi:hypothetical protein
MNKWAGFYERLFNFREIRYFDIEGKKTGLFSKAMTSPCGKIRIPINESQDDKSQIEEYIREYHGEGIQHIALFTDDIYSTVDALRSNGVEFQDTPETYYEGVAARVDGHRESLARMQERRILIDGSRERRHPAADLHPERHRPDLLRDHPAEGQRGFRRGQLPRTLRVHRARPGAARRDLNFGVPEPVTRGA